eukprot:m.70548 g.70548  ORF g.70548 m.70548 type:complete len:598 (+) comp12144_c0_seq1:451-2244(+)
MAGCLVHIILVLVLCILLQGKADVIWSEFRPPAECEHGCAVWEDVPEAREDWENTTLLQQAGSFCAEPGRKFSLTPWCYCAKGNATKGKMDINWEGTPTHPLANRTLKLRNTYPNEGYYLSFTYGFSPPGLSGGLFVRATYGTISEATPLRFDPVLGKNDTYILYNLWPGYEGYLVWDNDYLRVGRFNTSSEAVQIQFTPSVVNNSYYAVDAPGSFISFCLQSCSGNKWIMGGYTEVKDAMSLQLFNASEASFETFDRANCRRPMSTPYTISVHEGLNTDEDEVVILFVTLEDSAPSSPPKAFVSLYPNMTSATVYTGETSKRATDFVHAVDVGGLLPNTTYYYQVQSGSPGAVKSKVDSFISEDYVVTSTITSTSSRTNTRTVTVASTTSLTSLSSTLTLTSSLSSTTASTSNTITRTWFNSISQKFMETQSQETTTVVSSTSSKSDNSLMVAGVVVATLALLCGLGIGLYFVQKRRDADNPYSDAVTNNPTFPMTQNELRQPGKSPTYAEISEEHEYQVPVLKKSTGLGMTQDGYVADDISDEKEMGSTTDSSMPTNAYVHETDVEQGLGTQKYDSNSEKLKNLEEAPVKEQSAA